MKRIITFIAALILGFQAGAYNLGKTGAELDALTGDANSVIQLDTTFDAPYSAGQLSYDSESKTVTADTGFDGVRVAIGEEWGPRFFNATGVTITNGTVLNVDSVTNGVAGITNGIVTAVPIDISQPRFSSSPYGLATADVLAGEVGKATRFGEVHETPTTGLPEGGILYADTNGFYTSTFPSYPSRVIIIGTVLRADAVNGTIQTDLQIFTRGTGSKSYGFSQANIGAGTYYMGGFYEFPTTSIALSQASTNVSVGEVNTPYEAHASVVSGGNGTTDAGTVGIRVRGVKLDTATGATTANFVEVITTNISTFALDAYLETEAKWVSQPSFELYTTSGSPTTYSISINYGLSKYEDLNNNDFTVIGSEIVGTAGAGDSSFYIKLLHHKTTGWTYAATGFIPGDGAIFDSQDQAPYDDLVGGEPFAFKRPGLATFVNGDTDEGVLYQIKVTAQNSVTSLDAHLTAVIEELVY